MEARGVKTSWDEAQRRRLNRAVSRWHLDNVALEDEIRRALRERFDLSLPADWLAHRSESDVARTRVVRVHDRSEEGVFEQEGARILAVCVTEQMMDSIRDAAEPLGNLDGHRMPDTLLLTLLVRHLLDVRRLEDEIDREMRSRCRPAKKRRRKRARRRR